MNALAWSRAAALLKLPRAAGWPSTLNLLQAAALQTGFAGPAERREAHVFRVALTAACRAGEIACEVAQLPPPKRRIRVVGTSGRPRVLLQPVPQAQPVEVYRIGARAFIEWLRSLGVEPSPLVCAWAASQPAPEVQQAPTEGGKRWTPERVAAARAMRDKLKAAGHRDYAARTAAAFGVNTARLRQVLGPDETAPKKKKLLGWPPPARHIRRAK